MHRFLFISLALVCLLAGCSAPQTSDPATDESDSLDAYFEEEPADNEMGSAEFGLQDPMDTVYTYDGESLEIPFSITGASFGKTTEIGVLLFVDGVAQPYSAVYEDGTELEESYMQVFNLDYEQQENFDMVFQPMTGKAGETVPVMAVTILEPSFVAEGPDNPRYGFHHQESATTSRQISFATDAPTQTLAAAATDYNVVDLPQDILDTLAAWGATDSLDTTATLSLGVEDGNYIQADGKTATITVQLYGGPETDFNITLFINHQPVQLNGADYLSVRTVKNQMVEATFQIDTSALGTLNTVYAIAVTPEDGELEINNPVKTASVLLVNGEV